MPHPARNKTPASPYSPAREPGAALRIADSRNAIGQSRRLIVRSRALIEQTQVQLATLAGGG